MVHMGELRYLPRDADFRGRLSQLDELEASGFNAVGPVWSFRAAMTGVNRWRQFESITNRLNLFSYHELLQ